MPKYIKKPVEINATHFIERDFEHWEPWVQEGYNNKKWGYQFDPSTGVPNGFYVDTLEGKMCGGQGDYLIQGVRGEFYPCRGDIFEETYERVQS